MIDRSIQPPDDEPEPGEKFVALTPPETVSANPVALEVWNAVTTELTERGTLAETDLPLIVALALSTARHREAESEIARLGTIVKSSTGVPCQNPWLAVSVKAAQQIRQLHGALKLHTHKARQPSYDEALDARPRLARRVAE